MRYCTIEATKLTTDRHEASRGLCATAELLVNSNMSEGDIHNVAIVVHTDLSFTGEFRFRNMKSRQIANRNRQVNKRSK